MIGFIVDIYKIFFSYFKKVTKLQGVQRFYFTRNKHDIVRGLIVNQKLTISIIHKATFRVIINLSNSVILIQIVFARGVHLQIKKPANKGESCYSNNY